MSQIATVAIARTRTSAHPRPRLVRLCLLGAWMILGAPGVARARAADVEARAETRRAHRAYGQGRFEAALDAYAAAYGARPRPALLFEIAQCHRRLGHYESAAFFFQRYLDDSPPSAHTKKAAALLVEVQAKAGASQSQPAVDAARAEAIAPPTRTVTLSGPALERGAPAAAPNVVEQGRVSAERAPKAEPLVQGTTAPEPSKPLLQRWWFWTSIAGGAVLASCAITYAASTPHAPTPTLGMVHAQ